MGLKQLGQAARVVQRAVHGVEQRQIAELGTTVDVALRKNVAAHHQNESQRKRAKGREPKDANQRTRAKGREPKDANQRTRAKGRESKGALDIVGSN